MRICIAGAGAVGSVIAGYLLAHGKHAVSVLARGATLDAIRANGLVVESRGKRLAGRPQASERAADLGPQDVIVLAVKGYSVPEIAPALTPMIGPGTLIVTAQNGIPWWYFYGLKAAGHDAPESDTPFEAVDPGGVAWRTLGPEHAVGCVVTSPAERTAPGVTHHTGALRLTLGAPRAGKDGDDHHEALGDFCAELNEAGIEAMIASDIRLATWTKLQSQVATAPISVLTGGNNSEVANAPGLAGLKARAGAECVAVAHAWNVPLKLNPERQSAGNPGHKSSMLQDFEAGRPLELDSIVGAVLDLAKRRDVPVPTIEALWGLAKLRAETRGDKGMQTKA
jgi:2-dehydropantoate 2-reductase